MNFTKNSLFFIAIMVGFAFPKKADLARIVNSDIHSTIIEFNLEDFQLLPIQTVHGTMNVVKFKNGASMLKQGAPDLPKYSRSIIIPDDANMEIEILTAEFTDYEDVLIAPSKGNLTRRIDPNSITHEFGKEYERDVFFPRSLVELQIPYVLRDLRGQAVDIQPIHYNPISKVLRVYHHLIIKVYAEGKSRANVLNRKVVNQSIPREYQNIYEGHFSILIVMIVLII